ncbi:hypothetical protein JCM2811A_12640 [Methylorubrum rhodinum]
MLEHPGRDAERADEGRQQGDERTAGHGEDADTEAERDQGRDDVEFAPAPVEAGAGELQLQRDLGLVLLGLDLLEALGDLLAAARRGGALGQRDPVVPERLAALLGPPLAGEDGEQDDVGDGARRDGDEPGREGEVDGAHAASPSAAAASRAAASARSSP